MPQWPRPTPHEAHLSGVSHPAAGAPRVLGPEPADASLARLAVLVAGAALLIAPATDARAGELNQAFFEYGGQQIHTSTSIPALEQLGLAIREQVPEAAALLESSDVEAPLEGATSAPASSPPGTLDPDDTWDPEPAPAEVHQDQPE